MRGIPLFGIQADKFEKKGLEDRTPSAGEKMKEG
jgi:hypothetical protein